MDCYVKRFVVEDGTIFLRVSLFFILSLEIDIVVYFIILFSHINIDILTKYYIYLSFIIEFK